jgi:hypothetical protein
MKLAIGIVCAIGSAAAVSRVWRPKAPTVDAVSTIVELLGFGALTAAAFLFNLELGLIVVGALLVAAGELVIVDQEEVRRRPRAGAEH